MIDFICKMEKIRVQITPFFILPLQNAYKDRKFVPIENQSRRIFPKKPFILYFSVTRN